MILQPDHSCLRSRSVSIFIGVVTAIMWLPVAFALSRSYEFRGAFELPPLNAAMMCILTSSAMSVLMVVGVVKRIANYMFPWLAIHFALIIVVISMIFALILNTADRNGIQAEFIVTPIGMLIISIMVLWWLSVYLHYKDLNASQIQMQPKCAKEGEIMKGLVDPVNPYHPV